MSRKEIMVDLLSKVLEGQMTSTEALNAWPEIDEPTDNQLMKNAWHSLFHFDADNDIRAKEPAYEVRQKAALQTCLDKLRSALN